METNNLEQQKHNNNRTFVSMVQRSILFWLILGSTFVLGFYHLALEKPPSRSRARHVESLLNSLAAQSAPRSSTAIEAVAPINESGTEDYEPLRKLYPELYEKVPRTFVKRYKSPCWFDETNTLRCLPYFYQIGMPKCGTTDLWDKLVQHPQVKNVPKEPHWWSKRRNGWTGTPVHEGQVKRVRHMKKMADDSSIEWYLNWFEAFAVPNVKKDHNLVFGDGSVTTSFFSLAHWRTDFEGAKEPPYTLADLMHSVQPTAKIVVIVREPVSRFYSAHLYTGGRNAKSFQNAARKGVECMENCMQHHSDRFCAYQQTCDQIFRGMYSIYLSDWIKAFGPDQVHVIRLDDWISDGVEEYRKLIAFLELDPLSDGAIQSILGKNVKNSQKRKKAKAGEMLDSSRRLLQDFYRPYNNKLAQLLNSSKYLWDYG